MTVEVPVTDELDLHTFAPRDVPELIRHYLDLCVEKGFGSVRIVHGKGTGALRTTVHAILARDPRVASFRLADESGGGWGATLVDLKRLQ